MAPLAMIAIRPLLQRWRSKALRLWPEGSRRSRAARRAEAEASAEADAEEERRTAVLRFPVALKNATASESRARLSRRSKFQILGLWMDRKKTRLVGSAPASFARNSGPLFFPRAQLSKPPAQYLRTTDRQPKHNDVQGACIGQHPREVTAGDA